MYRCLPLFLWAITTNYSEEKSKFCKIKNEELFYLENLFEVDLNLLKSISSIGTVLVTYPKDLLVSVTPKY